MQNRNHHAAEQLRSNGTSTIMERLEGEIAAFIIVVVLKSIPTHCSLSI